MGQLRYGIVPKNYQIPKRAMNKDFIDWESEIKRLQYAQTSSNITIRDAQDQPQALEDLTVGNYYNTNKNAENNNTTHDQRGI